MTVRRRPAQNNGKSSFEHSVVQLPDSGMILVDTAGKFVGCDRGATAIFVNGSSNGRDGAARIPIADDILETILNPHPSDYSHRDAEILVGSRKYRCRAYAVECENSLAGTFTALHLQAAENHADRMADLAAEYHLTEREVEVIGALSQGLSTKEAARQMKISPNTVKAFVRLTMIKFGVGTRSELVVKVLSRMAGLQKDDS